MWRWPHLVAAVAVANVGVVAGSFDEVDKKECAVLASAGECKKNFKQMVEKGCADFCASSFYDLSSFDSSGDLVDFSKYRDRVVLVTNVASY